MENPHTERKEYLELIDKYPEMLDFLKVIIKGREKYPDENWLEKNGKSMSRKENYASITRHAAQYFVGEKIDLDSGLDHRLHLTCRALMSYVRERRGIVHLDDPNFQTQKMTGENCIDINDAIEKYKNSQYFTGDRNKT